ncbi:MAG: UDP-N-acetyl-D-glucosamine dehydrogenase, partial [Chloroflexi bacterium]|nr:UDP-N-acetyl-D-glucosamine dehydrogenase [Chloroflexota bacterium]
GAQVEYHDPYVPLAEGEGWSLKSSSDVLGGVKHADGVVLGTDHSGFDYQGIANAAKFVFDTRNAFRYRGIESSNIMRL